MIDYINPAAWSWPQVLVLVMLVLGLLVNVTNHGKPKVMSDGEPFKFDGVVQFLKVVCNIAVLALGGFFAHGVVG